MSDKIGDFIKEYGTACGGNCSDVLASVILAGLLEDYLGLEDRVYEFPELWDILEQNL